MMLSSQDQRFRRRSPSCPLGGLNQVELGKLNEETTTNIGGEVQIDLVDEVKEGNAEEEKVEEGKNMKNVRNEPEVKVEGVHKANDVKCVDGESSVVDPDKLRREIEISTQESLRKMICPRNPQHRLKYAVSQEGRGAGYRGRFCDECLQPPDFREGIRYCFKCDYDVCCTCYLLAEENFHERMEDLLLTPQTWCINHRNHMCENKDEKMLRGCTIDLFFEKLEDCTTASVQQLRINNVDFLELQQKLSSVAHKLSLTIFFRETDPTVLKAISSRCMMFFCVKFDLFRSDPRQRYWKNFLRTCSVPRIVISDIIHTSRGRMFIKNLKHNLSVIEFTVFGCNDARNSFDSAELQNVLVRNRNLHMFVKGYSGSFLEDVKCKFIELLHAEDSVVTLPRDIASLIVDFVDLCGFPDTKIWKEQK